MPGNVVVVLVDVEVDDDVVAVVLVVDVLLEVDVVEELLVDEVVLVDVVDVDVELLELVDVVEVDVEVVVLEDVDVVAPGSEVLVVVVELVLVVELDVLVLVDDVVLVVEVEVDVDVEVLELVDVVVAPLGSRLPAIAGGAWPGSVVPFLKKIVFTAPGVHPGCAWSRISRTLVVLPGLPSESRASTFAKACALVSPAFTRFRRAQPYPFHPLPPVALW